MAKLSRRKFLGAAAGTAATIAAGTGPAAVVQSAQVPVASGAPAMNLALVNGRIHTMDARNTIASAVSIRNGRFVTVGNAAPPRERDTRVIDLKGRTVVPGLVEPHIHSVSLANRPGYHTILENTTSIREIQEALAARRKDVPRGPVDHVDGRLAPEPVGRASPSDAAGTRRRRCRIGRCCSTSDSPVRARPTASARRSSMPPMPRRRCTRISRKVNVADNGAIAAAGFAGGGPSASALFHLRRLQTFEDKKRSTLDAMNYSASVGLTAHLDQVLFPTPGPLHPNQILSNLDQYRMYDSWLALHREGKTIIRLQMNFLQNQNDPALPELKERLRNQFQFFGDDMMMTGSIGEWAAPLGSGAVWREAQRLVAAGRMAERKQRAEPGGPDAGGRGLRSGEQGVRHHRPALDGPPRAGRHARPARRG